MSTRNTLETSEPLRTGQIRILPASLHTPVFTLLQTEEWCVWLFDVLYLLSGFYTFNAVQQAKDNIHTRWSSLLMILNIIVGILFLSASWVRASFKLGWDFQSHYPEHKKITSQQKPLASPPFSPFQTNKTASEDTAQCRRRFAETFLAPRKCGPSTTMPYYLTKAPILQRKVWLKALSRAHRKVEREPRLPTEHTMGFVIALSGLLDWDSGWSQPASDQEWYVGL